MDSTEIHDREFLIRQVEKDGEFNDGIGGFVDIEVVGNVLKVSFEDAETGGVTKHRWRLVPID